MPDNLTHKYGVSVTLISRHEGETSILNVSGEAAHKGPQLYIRFEEPGQGPDGAGEAVRTTVKIRDDELRIIRHGGVQSEQSFRSGARLPGFYRSPYTQFNLSTETRALDISRQGRSLTVQWEYDLYVYEELSGQFAISLHIQEEPLV
ncbi:uncharacterized beta-barrel protein YwiB (DUF1934 family) [Paenibacillus forsythiae]|uniref:Uncharacterized beta-barrel protein YwiB (DUF1934 family) n=1 Tax=Paenibacillus forsythiae TaxID=365616 RepID=A0ABU3HDX1_9BACL|nr:DUF1934 domain-containing protein [Paenibacillus forsythiae]MDT3429006.1 uncharacterized beta-barrel protein YwiB (DUF1934 family) [Paenibacillus forsythiae]